MMIKVKLFAQLREKLPPESNGQEMDLETAEGTTTQQVIEQLEIPPQLAHLCMIDGHHLLPDEIRSRSIMPGETLAIFPPIAGG